MNYDLVVPLNVCPNAGLALYVYFDLKVVCLSISRYIYKEKEREQSVCFESKLAWNATITRLTQLEQI